MSGPGNLGYLVSFAFICGVWIAHSNMMRFIKAADPALMRLNLMLLPLVSPQPARMKRRQTRPRRICGRQPGPGQDLGLLALELLTRDDPGRATSHRLGWRDSCGI